MQNQSDITTSSSSILDLLLSTPSASSPAFNPPTLPPTPSSTMSDWLTLSFICILLGFLLVVLALSGARHDLSGADGAVEALEICGFVAFMITVVGCALVRYVEMDYKDEIGYATAGLSFLAVVFILVGLILYACRVSRKPPPYTTTLLVCGSLLSALTGVFILLQVFDV